MQRRLTHDMLWAAKEIRRVDHAVGEESCRTCASEERQTDVMPQAPSVL